MSVEFYRESPGKLDSRTLSRKTLSRWTGRIFLVWDSGKPSPDPGGRVVDTFIVTIFIGRHLKAR